MTTSTSAWWDEGVVFWVPKMRRSVSVARSRSATTATGSVVDCVSSRETAVRGSEDGGEEEEEEEVCEEVGEVGEVAVFR